MNNEKFIERYKKLNTAQKKAVDAIQGPVMVIAGPGTGKTEVLTLRIANILIQTDTAPANILALTFTESGTHSMRKRLVEIIGSAAYKVNIHTFHGFCNEIIQKYPEDFPRIIGSSRIIDSDQIKAVESIIEKSNYSKIKSYGDPFFYVQSILDAIRNLKREDIDPVVFEKLIKKQKSDFKKIPDLYHEKGAFKGEMKGKYRDLEKSIEKNSELCDAYLKYEATLRKKKWIDYEDMIMEVIRELKKNRDLLLRLEEEYQYIVADEHQDANNSQNELLELLGSYHKNPNLFVVGDEKQAIFRFQGASLENFLYFKKIYPEALIVNLKENYRSPQYVLDGAHSLISHTASGDPALRVVLKSNVESVEEKIILRKFSKSEYEYGFLAKDIEDKIKNGAVPGSIAVLYRDNKDVFPILKIFEKAKIPHVVNSSQDVLSDPDISKLIHIFRAVYNYGDDTELVRMLHVDFIGIEPIETYRILKYGREEKKSLFSVIKSKEDLKLAGVEDIKIFDEIYKKITRWNKASHNISLVDFFDLVIKESGFLDFILEGNGAIDKMNKLSNFFDEIKKIVEVNKEARLSDLIYYLNVIRDYHVLLRVKEEAQKESAVRLMTAHKAKGQEYDYVYIVGVNDKHWGNRRGMASFRLPIPGQKLGEDDSLDDERRLFYVALTRAKKQVYLSYSEMGENKEDLLPSQFIEEIDKKHVDEISMKEMEKKIVLDPVTFGSKMTPDLTIKNKKYLQGLFLNQGLSVTALNNYLECPWRYFFRSLVRVPESQEKPAMYGTAIHLALAHFFNKYKVEEDLSKRELVDFFKKSLDKMPLSLADLKEVKTKGEEALGGYYDVYKNTWSRNLFTEYRVSGVFVDIKVSNEPVYIALKGTLDKIEFLSEKNVRVVDYKTSKPVSRNEIEGKTKNATGNFKRQLVFYKLLLEKHTNLDWCMKEGMLDFIEPAANGKYKRESFDIGEEELHLLEEEIKNVSREIYNLEFWEKSCDDKQCEYCRLRKMMK